MESLSDESDDNLEKESIDDNVRFEDELTLHHLKVLMREFAQHVPSDDMPPDGFVTPGRVVKRQSGNVTVKEFKEMIHDLLRTTVWDAQMETFFAKVDTSADGMVDWNELCTYMLLHYRENDNAIKVLPLKYEPQMRHITQNKQEVIQCVISLENPPRYVTLSKKGIISVLDAHFLRIERTYEIRNENENPRVAKRCYKTWYTDVTPMGNASKIVIGSTSRDLRFWDVSCPTSFFEEFQLYALPYVPECLDYWYDSEHPSRESVLIVGDDEGSVHLYHFLKPLERLFQSSFTAKEGVKKIWARDLPNHQCYVLHTVVSGVHTEMVRKVRYLPDNDSIISSSSSKTTSLVLRDTQGKRKIYTFRMSKGVECFDFNKGLNIIATGSTDHIVYLWNPFVQEGPTACLIGHMMTVVGVAINQVTEQVYSFAKDGVIKVWDLKEYTCLQTYPLRFPCLQHLRSPEYGSSCLILHQQSLVACCGDYIGTIKMGVTELTGHLMPKTHEAQLCCAIYNSFFKQVATAADDSCITVWDLTSGVKSFSILEAHDKEDITCMVFNTTGRKMITGARNGTIKVWNFQNGHNINQFEPVAEAEVTGLVSLGKRRGVLAVGWSRQIVFYNDTDSETLLVKAETGWKGGQIHKDDILAVDYCPPNLLATAGFDGEIIVWSVETEMIFIRLRKGKSNQVKKRLKEALSLSDNPEDRARKCRKSTSINYQLSSGSSSYSFSRSRPNNRCGKHGHPSRFQQAPVDKILFLKSRIVNKGLTEGDVLVSSEAGYLHFWSICGFSNNLRGIFYASDSITKEESVLAMTSNADDSMLITGDTMGHVYIWDISSYCLEPTKKFQLKTHRPPLLRSWHAHELAVVSVECIQEDYGSFMLTASTDCTARLWTMEGHYVGTFGQSRQWNLRNPHTYQHPRSPWSHLEGANVLKDKRFPHVKDPSCNIISKHLAPKGSSDKCSENKSAIVSHVIASDASNIDAKERYKDKISKAELESLPTIQSVSPRQAIKDQPGSSVSIMPSPILSNNSPSRSKSRQGFGWPLITAGKSVPGDSRDLEATLSGFISEDKPGRTHFDLDCENKNLGSLTYKSGGTESKSALSLLGYQVDKDFARITHSRQERRQRWSRLDVKATQRFDKLCSPFQALRTLKTDEVIFPATLPMTPRMLTRGLTCTSEEELRHLALSPVPGESCRKNLFDRETLISSLPTIQRRSSRMRIDR